MRNLLRIRNARIFLFGDVVSTLGDNALWLAMAIWMKELTGSSAWAGLVIFCFTAGNLFSPLGGVVADRFPRRALLVGANLLAAGIVLLILLVHGRSSMWIVYLVMFLYGVVGSAMVPAQTALLPAIVPGELLAEANAAQQTLTQGLRMVTPLIGAGLFVLVGGGVVAVIDAATFGVAILSLLALRLAEPAGDPQAAGEEVTAEAVAAEAVAAEAATVVTGVPAAVAAELTAAGAAGTEAASASPSAGKGGMSAGFRFLADEPVLRTLTIALGLALLAFGFTESAAYSVVTVGLHHSASFVGVLSTVQGAGAIAGGLVAAALLHRTSELALTAIGLCCAMAAVLLLTLSSLPAVLVAMIFAGVTGPWVNVAAITALQSRTPPALLGRVVGVFELSLTIPQISSIGLGAALIAVVNYRVLLVAVAVAAALAVIYLVTAAGFRRHPAPAPAPAEAPVPETPVTDPL